MFPPSMFSETSVSRCLKGWRYRSSHACPSTHLSGRNCCQAVHSPLNSPAFQSCFTFPLQSYLCFNVFVMPAGLLHDLKKKNSILPCFATSSRHVQSGTCSIIYFMAVSQGPDSDSSSFQQTFLQSMIKSNKL